MDTISIKELIVSEYTTHSDIYSLQIRTEKNNKWLYINYTDGYNLKQWTIEEAINHYLSDEGKAERFESWYHSYCD